MKSPPPLNPRFTFYFPDGTGRDDYISVNNGGFLRTNKLTRVFNPLISPKIVHHQDLTLSKPLNHYNLSGNGRDLYIYCGNPVNQKYQSHKVNFPQLLRSESTGCIINKTKYPFQLSNKEKELIKQQKIFQSNLLDRIYYKDLEKKKTKYLNSTQKNNSMNSGDSFNNTSTKFLTKSSSTIQFNPIFKNKKPIRNIRLIKNHLENLKKNVVVSPNEINYDGNLTKNLKKMFNWNHSVQNWKKS